MAKKKKKRNSAAGRSALTAGKQLGKKGKSASGKPTTGKKK